MSRPDPWRSSTLGSEFSPEEPEPSWISGGRFRYPIIPESNPWETSFKSVHRHDKEMCDKWRDEVDKLLIFAGLFSAAVTAFAVESFKWLQPDPVEVLAAMVAHPGQASPPIAQFVPAPFAVRVNIFWFFSLVLSLSTVVVGVLSMQWLREYQRDDSNTAAIDSLGLRQMRYQGMLAWRVPEIVNALPVLLQTAVLLFFCGILDLLWAIHRHVAIAITVPVALLAFCLLATTVLPAIQYTFTHRLNLRIAQCPYKSPQSWIFHRLFSSFCVFGIRITEYLNFKSLFHYETRERHSLIRKLFAASDWRAYDKRWRQQRDLQLNKPQPGGLYGHVVVREDVSHALSWIINSFSRDLRTVTALYKCFQSLSDNEKETMLLACDHITPLSIDFRNKLGGENTPAISDYLCLRALDHLLSVIGYGSDATQDLLQHRVELYIRISRASIHLPQRPMLYCPFRYYPRFSEQVQIQLLKLATIILSQSERASDSATAVVILSQTSTHPAIRLPPVFSQMPRDIGQISTHSPPLVGFDRLDSWEELRQRFSEAVAEATNIFSQRTELLKQQPVRVEVYRWFLRLTSSSMSSSVSAVDTVLSFFKAVAPIVQSSLPLSSTVPEYPTNLRFEPAWKLLLQGRDAELLRLITKTSRRGDTHRNLPS